MIHTADGAGDAATASSCGTCCGCNLDDAALLSVTSDCSTGGWLCCVLSLSG